MGLENFQGWRQPLWATTTMLIYLRVTFFLIFRLNTFCSNLYVLPLVFPAHPRIDPWGAPHQPPCRVLLSNHYLCNGQSIRTVKSHLGHKGAVGEHIETIAQGSLSSIGKWLRGRVMFLGPHLKGTICRTANGDCPEKWKLLYRFILKNMRLCWNLLLRTV